MKLRKKAALFVTFILICTLVMSLFTVIASDLTFGGGEIKAINFNFSRIDIVHTTDLSIKGEVITIVEEIRTFNLLDLQQGVLARLGIDITALPEGFVTQIRFYVYRADLVVDGLVYNLFIPGGVIRLEGILDVPGGIDAIFSFDADKSVSWNRGLGLILKPTITFETFTNNMNAQFIKWQEESHIIHIIVHDDAGRPGQPVAEVNVGQVVLFGFEWRNPGGSLEELQNNIISNSAHDITLSVNGGTTFSVKNWYQEAFVAVPGVGPQWSWDHDNDGLGDGDGDGTSDWDGPILFFRYYYPLYMTAGTHTFTFSYTFDDGANWSPSDPPETITVVAS